MVIIVAMPPVAPVAVLFAKSNAILAEGPVGPVEPFVKTVLIFEYILSARIPPGSITFAFVT